ncbi:MAG TPA: substrate-binding domain-containing protein [Gaiellaceae bacterium]|nr:substrate-binding domain-containing protein [Gaiellaceae bacterium]
MNLSRRTLTVAALAVAATAVMVLSAVAGASGEKSASKGPWVIGLSNGYYGNGARVQLEAEVKALAAQAPYKGMIKQLVINNAGTSVAAQISAVDQMIAQHVNAIILDSNSLTGLNPAIVAAHKAGIPVVASNDKVSSPLAYQVETVGKSFGATMMKAFAKVLHGKGNIVILRGLPGNAVDAAEAAGFHGVLKGYPNIHVLKETYGQWDDGQAQKVMADLLSRYQNIDGVFTEGGMQQGVVRAYVAAHRSFVPVSGTDENGFACQVKQYHSKGLQGVQVSTAMWADAVALKQALSILQGKKVAHFIPGSFVVWNTAESIKQCQPKLSPSLFLEVSAPAYGVNLTPQEVLKYMH